MQLHYIWYYKILIKTCSCYHCEHLFFPVWAGAHLQHCITANKTWHVFLPSKLSSTTQGCHHFTLVAYTSYIFDQHCYLLWRPQYLIIANNSIFFRIATFPCGWFFSFHMTIIAGKYFPLRPAVQSCFDCTSCAQHNVWWLHHTFSLSSSCLLNAPTWQAARNAPHFNVNSRAVPMIDASSDVLTTLFAVS